MGGLIVRAVRNWMRRRCDVSLDMEDVQSDRAAEVSNPLVAYMCVLRQSSTPCMRLKAWYGRFEEAVHFGCRITTALRTCDE
jgi:hypothetical protein